MLRPSRISALRAFWLGALALAPALRAAPEHTRMLGPPAPIEERTEHFLLVREREDASGDDARASDGPCALAEWRRRKADGGWQLELDVVFPGGELRVYAVECLSAKGPRLVWREISVGAGRTVLAEWTEGGAGLRTLEWGTDGSLREGCDASRGAVMPLYLVELLRLGRVGSGSQLVFDPLARGLERVAVHTSYAALERGAGFERVVELVRDDDSLAGRYVFRGESLIAFRWHEGGWNAQRIEAPEHARRLREMKAPPVAKSP